MKTEQKINKNRLLLLLALLAAFPPLSTDMYLPAIPFLQKAWQQPLAISKDVYDVHERERILAYIGVIMALAPMLAPVFGGWLMIWFSWRWVFVVQGMIAAVAWIGVFSLPETLKSPADAGALPTAGIYLQLLRNRRYVGFALMMSIYFMLGAFAM